MARQRPALNREVYEEKYDGYRILAYKEGDRVRLLSRHGRDWTAEFPEIAAAVAAAPAETLLLDGEVVIFDRHLVSRFDLLRRRDGVPIYAVFDCLYRDGRDLRRRPFWERRRALEAVVRGVDRLFPARRLGADGLAAFEVARRRGYEGIVAKDPRAPYRAGRSEWWLEVPLRQEADFVIGGYRGRGGRLTGLLLGAYQDGALRYVGEVEFGPGGEIAAALWSACQPLVVPESPFRDTIRKRHVTWLRPQLVAEVSYQEWLAGELRDPCFRGIGQRRAAECRIPDAA